MRKRPKKKLLDQVRDVIRLKHYSIRTEKAYVSWIRRYILFYNKQHPKETETREIEVFLTHLILPLFHPFALLRAGSSIPPFLV